MEKNEKESGDPLLMKSLVVLFSYHHRNTEKIANVFAKVLDAQIKTPQQINPEELQEFSLIGFGSGIYSAKHHQSLLDLADKLPHVNDRKAFIFSTCGVPVILCNGEQFGEFVVKNHSLLREKLQSKGYTIIDEFGCAGFNTNSFLKLFGGLNKGRPDAEDLRHAEEFAWNLKQLTGMEKKGIKKEISL
jgi:flavodoxin